MAGSPAQYDIQHQMHRRILTLINFILGHMYNSADIRHSKLQTAFKELNAAFQGQMSQDKTKMRIHKFPSLWHVLQLLMD